MSINKIFTRVMQSKIWRNLGDYCDRKHHLSYFPYRAYRRGKKRCNDCGAKIGKVKMVRKSNQEMIVDNVYSENPLFKALKEPHGG